MHPSGSVATSLEASAAASTPPSAAGTVVVLLEQAARARAPRKRRYIGGRVAPRGGRAGETSNLARRLRRNADGARRGARADAEIGSPDVGTGRAKSPQHHGDESASVVDRGSRTSGPDLHRSEGRLRHRRPRGGRPPLDGLRRGAHVAHGGGGGAHPPALQGGRSEGDRGHPEGPREDPRGPGRSRRPRRPSHGAQARGRRVHRAHPRARAPRERAGVPLGREAPGRGGAGEHAGAAAGSGEALGSGVLRATEANDRQIAAPGVGDGSDGKGRSGFRMRSCVRATWREYAPHLARDEGSLQLRIAAFEISTARSHEIHLSLVAAEIGVLGVEHQPWPDFEQVCVTRQLRNLWTVQRASKP